MILKNLYQWPVFRLLFFVSLWGSSLVSYGQSEVFQFDHGEQRSLYQELILELRCLVCQNQNIADSNAELAQDLRKKTYEMILAGKTRDEIVEFMVNRYGDFVLYKPPLKANTIFLWLSPFILFLLILFILYRRSRLPSRDSGNGLSPEQIAQAKALLEQSDKAS